MPEGHLLHRLARDLGELAGQELTASLPQGKFADGAARIDGAPFDTAEADGKHPFEHFAGNDADVAGLLARLGPDPLRDDADPERALASLHATPGALGAALFDQSVIAGIGNVFRTEALYACGLHPAHPAASLTRAEFDRLCSTGRAMLRRAVDDGRIVTVDPPAGQPRTEVSEGEARYVYQQDSCGAAVESWTLGERTAYSCPVDQPAA